MRYLINHNCIYNEDKNEIKNTENALTVKMTAMRARCLSFIIENASDNIIDKRKITAALWGERGQYVSDANLTQLLYLIRKDLRTMGIDDFFVTIPRMGIRVNKLVSVARMPDKNIRQPYSFWKTIIAATFLLSLVSGFFFLNIIS